MVRKLSTSTLSDLQHYRICKFSSYGHFLTNEDGNLNLEKTPSSGGSYKGVFPAGLLTTLSSKHYENKDHRLYRRDASKPWKITIGITNNYVELTQRHKFLSQVELERHLMAPGTKRIPVRHGKVRGLLFLPPGHGPFPGVILLYGLVAGVHEYGAALLASRGFATLSLSVYGYEDLPPTPEELHLDYFEEAVCFLISQPDVIQDRCAAVVSSKAGEIGLYMATEFEPVKALIGTGAITFPLLTKYYFRGKPYAKGIMIPEKLLKQTEDGSYYTDISSFINNDFPHMIPVEKIENDTHILLAYGDDDTFGIEASIQPFCERMEMNGKTNYEIILYEGAGHVIQLPYESHNSHTYQHFLHVKSFWAKATWGGRSQATSEAQVHFWKKMQDFLNRHVRDESPWFQRYLDNSRYQN